MNTDPPGSPGPSTITVDGPDGRPMFELAATVVANRVEVRLWGELCLMTAPVLGAYLESVLTPGRRSLVAIDASGLSLLTAAGIRVLLATHERCEAAGCDFTIRNPSEPARHVLVTCRLDWMIDEVADAR